MKKIIIASDHGAVALKSEIVSFLQTKNCEVNDLGVNSDDSVDYPDIAVNACNEFKKGGYDFGILLCGTGIGMSIAANKVSGVYAALCADTYSAERAIKSNNANVLTIGAFTTGLEVAKQIVKIWMESVWQTGTSSEPKVASFVEYAKKHQV